MKKKCTSWYLQLQIGLLLNSLFHQSVITIQRVTQVDLISQGVTELDAHKLSIPSSLHILLSTAFRVGIRFKWELSPDGIFACEEFIYSERISSVNA